MPPKSPPDTVETFLAALEHPSKPEILALREIILGIDPAITEGIKWNAPSFRTADDFATFHLKAKDGIQIILHRGAKKRTSPMSRDAIADSDGLLEWLGDDRATVKFRNLEEIQAKRSAFEGILRQWIQHV